MHVQEHNACMVRSKGADATAEAGSSSGSRKQQQKQEAAAEAGSSSRSRKQQQKQEAAAEAGCSSYGICSVCGPASSSDVQLLTAGGSRESGAYISAQAEDHNV
jgi:RNA polymerase-binding transcription factor DksA